MDRCILSGRFRRGALISAGILALSTWACSDEIVSVLPVAVVEVEPSELSLQIGESGTMNVVLRAARGEVLSGRPVAWTSDEPFVASVDAQGRVTGGTAGETIIRVSSEGQSGSARVLVHRGPMIRLAEEVLSIRGITGRGPPIERQVGITNPEGGMLSGLTATVEQIGGPPQSWLQAVLLGTAAPTSVVVIARAMDLAPGSYSGAVVVHSQVAGNSPQVLVVELEVEEPPPEIRLVPSSVALAGVTGDLESASLTVDVENMGAGTLGSLALAIHYLDGDTSGWLEAELASSDAPTALSLRASPRVLNPGSYRAQVEVSSPEAANHSARVEVVFSVSSRIQGGGPSLGVSTPADPQEGP